eukprot:5757880-Prymnesium_polylepis.2
MTVRALPKASRTQLVSCSSTCSAAAPPRPENSLSASSTSGGSSSAASPPAAVPAAARYCSTRLHDSVLPAPLSPVTRMHWLCPASSPLNAPAATPNT